MVQEQKAFSSFSLLKVPHGAIIEKYLTTVRTLCEHFYWIKVDSLKGGGLISTQRVQHAVESATPPQRDVKNLRLTLYNGKVTEYQSSRNIRKGIICKRWSINCESSMKQGNHQ